MKVAVGLRRVAAGKRTSGRRAAQIATAFFSVPPADATPVSYHQNLFSPIIDTPINQKSFSN